MVERQGTVILRVEAGHFKDMTEDVAWISQSCALLTTANVSIEHWVSANLDSGLLTIFDYLLFADTGPLLKPRYQQFRLDLIHDIDNKIVPLFQTVSIMLIE